MSLSKPVQTQGLVEADQPSEHSSLFLLLRLCDIFYKLILAGEKLQTVATTTLKMNDMLTESSQGTPTLL